VAEGMLPSRECASFVGRKKIRRLRCLPAALAQPPFCCANCIPIVWSCRGCCVVSFVIWASSTEGVRHQRRVGSVERFWRVGLVCDSVGHYCRLAFCFTCTTILRWGHIVVLFWQCCVSIVDRLVDCNLEAYDDVVMSCHES
jgi:hypothetical protein